MPEVDRIIIGSDHAGFLLKDFIKSELTKIGIASEDVSEPTLDPSDDYPRYAARVARTVSTGQHQRGIAVCGSGIGASIAANRFRHVRAALCVTPEMARMARKHNDSNVLVMGERITTREVALEILKMWLDTPFEGGRHQRRVTQLDEVADERT
jgi:ribose 5-phosphate isomerase B